MLDSRETSPGDAKREAEQGLRGSSEGGTWPLRLIEMPVGLAGYSHGHRYPCLIVAVSIKPSEPAVWLPRAEHLLDQVVGPPRGPIDERPSNARSPVISALLRWMLRIQNACGVPVLDGGSVIFENSERATLHIPSLATSHKAHGTLVGWIVKFFGLVANGQSTDRHLGELVTQLDALKHHWQQRGGNVPRMLKAAHAKQIPFKELPGNVIQYGYGSRAHWMESSFTETTSRIGVGMARIKDISAAVLQQAGVPVPQHMRVKSEEAALEAAEKLSYPVVVKPADKDGGLAVAAGLTTPDQVRKALARAIEASPNILIEKHFEGRDYRVTVHKSEVIWVAERIPGGVVGNGRNSVAELVAIKANASAARGHEKYALVLDEEALDFLARAGLTPDSVPAEGESIRLRGAANLARGGSFSAALHLIHPDNKALAIRAVEALRLDLAGVDLLIPDISKSWREVGAVVCEVNAQPDLGLSGPHLYGQMLDRLLGEDSRIPIVVVLGAADDSSVVSEIAASLSAGGRIVGLADSRGVKIGDHTVSTEARGPYAGSQLLMLDRTVEAAVVSVNDGSILRSGLAFDRFDVLVLAGRHLTNISAENIRNGMASLLKALMPMCTGSILTLAGSGVKLAPPFDNCSAVVEDQPVAAGQVGQAVAARMKAVPRR